MILITNNIRKLYHAAFKKARREKIRAVRLNALLWYAARFAEGHGQYLIRFHVIPEVGGGEQVFVSCNSIDGERCKGTLRRKGMEREPMCVHIAEVVDRGIQYGKRKQKIETKEAA